MKRNKVFVILIGLLITAACIGLSACSAEPSLSSFALKDGTLKTSYVVGETLSLDGAKISKTMTDGSVMDESITVDMVSGFSTQSSGTRAMLITYKGLVAAIDYTVTMPVLPTVNSIAVKNGSLISVYLINSELILTNAKLITQFSDGTKGEVGITADMVSGFDSSAVGKRMLLISYQGKVCMFNYEILAVQKTLATPELVLNGNVLSWDKQAMSSGYEIYLQNESVATVTDSFYTIEQTEIGEYVYSVKAKGNGVSVLDSEISSSVTYTTSHQSISKIVLDEKGFSWQDCIGATGYTVNVDGVEHTVTQTRFDMTFEENTTYIASVKVYYGQDHSTVSKNYAFHALMSPTNLTISENISNKQFTFTWERENCLVDTGYTLYYKTGEEIHSIATGITGKTYTTSFSTFKDKTIDAIFVSASNRGDCISLGKTNEVQLPAQITTLQRPSGMYITANYAIHWNQILNVDEYQLYIPNNILSTSTSGPIYDPSELIGGTTYTLSVKSSSNSPYRYDSGSATFVFYKHAAPTNLKMNGSVVEFSGNSKALLYEVSFQGKTYIISDFSMDFSEQIAALGAGSYTVGVRSLPSGLVANEVPSQVKNLTFNVSTLNFSLRGTTLGWNAVSGATGYRVKIDDGEWTDNGNKTSVIVTTDMSTVQVAPYNIRGSLPVIDNTVQVLTLTYDTNGGTPINPVIRFVGGTIGTLPTATKYSGNVIGVWYDSVDLQTQKLVKETDILTNDTTIYAIYENILTYTVGEEYVTVTGLKYTPGENFSIDIPAKKDGKPVISIESQAFRQQEWLESVTIPNSIISIGNLAFFRCEKLTNVVIPTSVTSISNNAFNLCNGLESISVDSGNATFHSSGNCIIKTATKEMILGCKNSVIPTDGSVTSIASGFTCSGLTNITIPETIISIGNYAFEACSGLTSIRFNGTMAEWKRIIKGDQWNTETGNYTVTCTDGTLTKEES